MVIISFRSGVVLFVVPTLYHRIVHLSRGFVKIFVEFFSSICTKKFWQMLERRKLGALHPPARLRDTGYYMGVGIRHVPARLETWTIDLPCTPREKWVGGVFRVNKLFTRAKSFALGNTILKSISNFGIRAKKKNGVKPRPFEKLYAYQSSIPRHASTIGASCSICKLVAVPHACCIPKNTLQRIFIQRNRHRIRPTTGNSVR